MPIDCKFFDWYNHPLTKYYKDLLLQLKDEDDGEVVAEAKARVSNLKQELEMMKEKHVREVAILNDKYQAVNIRAKVLGFALGLLVIANVVMVGRYYLV